MRNNQPIVMASGIPAAVFGSIDRFDDFLCRGDAAPRIDPSEFCVDSLTPSQYNALVTLTESYFRGGLRVVHTVGPSAV